MRSEARSNATYWMVAGTVLHIAEGLTVASHAPGWLGPIYAALLVNAACLLLSIVSNASWPVRLYMATCIFFIPVGFVGMTGARRYLDALRETAFLAQRNP